MPREYVRWEFPQLTRNLKTVNGGPIRDNKRAWVDILRRLLEGDLQWGDPAHY